VLPDINEMLTFLAWENSFITAKPFLCRLIQQQRRMPKEFLIGSKNFIGSLKKYSFKHTRFKSNVQSYECLISFVFFFLFSNSGLLDNHTAAEEFSSSSGHFCNY